VIELSGLPCRSGVAHFTSLRDPLLCVIGIVSVLVILQVARDTVGLRDVVVVVDVTIGAGARRNGVLSGQWKSRF